MLAKTILVILIGIGCLFLWKLKALRRFVLEASILGFGLMFGFIVGLKLFYFLL